MTAADIAAATIPPAGRAAPTDSRRDGDPLHITQIGSKTVTVSGGRRGVFRRKIAAFNENAAIMWLKVRKLDISNCELQ